MTTLAEAAGRRSSSAAGPACGAPGPDGADVLAEMEVIVAAMERVSGRLAGADGWQAPVRRSVLGRLDRAVDGLTTVRAAVLVAERDAGTWREAGDRSPQCWRARTGRTGPGAAAQQVRQAEQLDAVPAVAAAVTAGRIGLEHAVVIGKVAATGTPAQREAIASPAVQQDLLAAAERQDAGTFAGTMSRWAATVDPGGLEHSHETQRAERYLHLTHTPEGTFVKGRLDSMAGHRLTRALGALSPRPAADDDRSPGQRCADALDAMAAATLADAGTTPGAHVPAQVSLIVSAETWADARAERDRRRQRGTRSASSVTHAGPAAAAPSGAGGGSDTDVVAYAPASLEDGTPVPASEIAATMCDCEITRLVIDADGVPVDLGRTQRLFTGTQRRAVIARDRRCAWPDCQVHARWCQIHHILWWERDTGPTSVDNGILLCSFHHHEVHRRDLTITRIGPQALDVPTPIGSCSSQAAAFAPMAYEFRDRRGRVVGRPFSAGPPGGASPGPAPTGGPPSTLLPSDGQTQKPPSHGEQTRTPPSHGEQTHTPPPSVRQRQMFPASGGGPPAADDEGPPGRRAPSVEDHLESRELTWVTDPFTGTRVPALFLDR
jgi:hypothetical protein